MSKHSQEDNNASVDTASVDTTAVDPAAASRGLAADPGQSDSERDEAIHEFDDHLDGSGDKPGLPSPKPEDVVTDTPSDPKTTTRTE